ncbi:MAG: hypothetical protein GKS06_11400 [Acidobacteria bacterium]|nr:hypothetical protein [Acidobacteriota bacterium]
MADDTPPSIEQIREWLAHESMSGYGLMRRCTWPGRKPAVELLYIIDSTGGEQSRKHRMSHDHYRWVTRMFWRSRRLYEAILFLLDAAQPEEAAILARSLFEDSMRLMELAEDENKRDARIIWWMNDSIQRAFNLQRGDPAFEVEDRLILSRHELEGRRAGLQRYAAYHGVTKYERFSSPKDAATRFDRKMSYSLYMWAHQATHGNDAVWGVAAVKRPEGGELLNAKTADVLWLKMVANFAIQAVFDAMIAAASVLGWAVPEEAFSKLDEYQQARDEQ